MMDLVREAGWPGKRLREKLDQRHDGSSLDDHGAGKPLDDTALGTNKPSLELLLDLQEAGVQPLAESLQVGLGRQRLV
jgi:hypothetical protein